MVGFVRGFGGGQLAVQGWASLARGGYIVTHIPAQHLPFDGPSERVITQWGYEQDVRDDGLSALLAPYTVDAKPEKTARHRA
jgi:hypothetical protein